MLFELLANVPLSLFNDKALSLKAKVNRKHQTKEVLQFKMKLYLVSAGAYFAFLLFSKFSDQECSKTNAVSWLVVVIASTLWIFVVPISLIEIKFKAKAKARFEEELTNSRANSQHELVKEVDLNNTARRAPENENT
ncbi:hypothetical protein IQ255_21135 [Pleurocapsales cyanobacterium LEGE 10410]|nr:hypothetical protein [Pleurocapsales cyanobacterium LEGE 10410]